MMSTSPDLSGPEPSSSKTQAPVKKRRTPGACDHCKKKKSILAVRCDSAEMIGNRCTNCIQFSLECTHKEVSKTLGSAKGYVESLEIRLEKMEKLMSKLLPKVDLNRELEQIGDTDTPPDISLLPRNDDDLLEEELTGKLKRLHVDPPQGRFFGKSSGYQLVQTALDIRSEYFGKEKSQQPVLEGQRSEFWMAASWHPSRFEAPSAPIYAVPDDDLLSSLVTAFFDQINPFFPLLHRPSFERSVSEGLHRHDTGFCGTLLLVCALGSRYSNDPRVLYQGTTSLHSAGWKWFEQVPVVRTSFVAVPSLRELQNHALSVLFEQSTETPQGCWTQLGTALRLGQEVGAHRRRALKTPTAEDEQWKRAFWVLMCLDRLISSFSGRQCVLQVEDYDVDQPAECDDEYWDNPDPSLAFKQPPNKPSTIAYFNCYLKLLDILAYTMRVIYSVKKPTLPSGKTAPYLDQKIIMELDSAMNDWMDSVPEHLRWDPSSSADPLFQKQSATLYATYYHLQIFIHRPFIPSFRNPSPTTFPSLAICTNAARSCCHVIEVQSRTSLPLPTLQITTFTAAVVLLLNIWSGKRSGFAPHPQREIDDVQSCINLLGACERIWCSAGRYRDILMELASAGDISFSSGSTNVDSMVGIKRPRESDQQPSVQSDLQYSELPKEYRKVAKARRVSTDVSPGHAPEAPFLQTLNFDLPMYGTELGRLPVYGQFNFSESSKRPRRESEATSAIFSFNTYEDGASNVGLPVNTAMGNVASMANAEPLLQANGFSASEWNSFNVPQVNPSMLPLAAAPYSAQLPIAAMDGLPLMDSDTLAMWSTAPTGFELNEWGHYITSVDQMTHSINTFLDWDE